MNRWAASPVPLSGAAFDGEQLYLRLSGTQSGVGKARGLIGGDVLSDASTFWNRLREHRHGFFDTSAPLWRLSVAPGSPPIDLPGKWLHDWGGAQRWLSGQLGGAQVRAAAERAGGHATLFRGGDRDGEVFQPLTAPLLRLHRNLKAAFDPYGLFNPGRVYPHL
jgi:glycolate oxidase FAD binding subunit